MAFQRMIVVSPELLENRSQQPPQQPVIKIIKVIKLIKSSHRYNKWTQVRVHQDPYLKTVKRTATHPHSVIGTGGTKPCFKKKPKLKRIIGLMPLFKTESESETVTLPTHSKYIQNVLTRKIFHDSTFCVYQDDSDGCLK